MPFKDKDRQRESNRERSKRYRLSKKGVTPAVTPSPPSVTPVTPQNLTRRAKWEELQKPLPKRKAVTSIKSNCIGLIKPCPICHARDGHPSGFCHLQG